MFHSEWSSQEQQARVSPYSLFEAALVRVRVTAPTGVAAFNVHGCTLHSLLQLPTKGDFKDLQGESLIKLQQYLNGVTYIIIDEMSMVGRKLMGQVDRRLRRAFPSCAHQILGGISCLLFGDFGQLPPVFDLPLFTTSQSSNLSDLGRIAYQSFNKAVVLTRYASDWPRPSTS